MTQEQRQQQTTNVRQRNTNINTEARLAILERDVQEVLGMVRQIDAGLRFPEQSPIGRTLTEKSQRNADAIQGVRSDLGAMGKEVDGKVEKGDFTPLLKDVNDLQKNFDELNGVVKALRMISLLVGIALGVFALFQVVQPPT
jgi:hypothetical protein